MTWPSRERPHCYDWCTLLSADDIWRPGSCQPEMRSPGRPSPLRATRLAERSRPRTPKPCARTLRNITPTHGTATLRSLRSHPVTMTAAWMRPETGCWVGDAGAPEFRFANAGDLTGLI